MTTKDPWRLAALVGTFSLLVASSCADEVPCAQQPCAEPGQPVDAGAPASGAGFGAAGEAALIHAGSGAGGAGAGAGGQEQAAFAGERALDGQFADDAGAEGGSAAESCRTLYLPLVVSREFWTTQEARDCPERAPYAAGKCAALTWKPDRKIKVSWEPGLPGCLEQGAGSVRFQARSADDIQVVSFSVAPGFETGAVALTSSWTTYAIDVSELPYDRFDSFGSVPPGITALSVTPIAATQIFVDDVRWLRASEPSP